MANRYNKSTNPSAANNTTGYLGSIGTTSTASGTVSQVSGLTSPWERATSARLTVTSAGVTLGYGFVGNIIDLPSDGGGQVWSITARFMYSNKGTGCYYGVWCFPQTGAAGGSSLGNVLLADITSSVTVNTSIRRSGVTSPLPAGTRSIMIFSYATSVPVNTLMTLGAVRAEQVNDSSLSYADGNTDSTWAWDGTAGSSSSTQTTIDNVINVSDSATSSESFQESASYPTQVPSPAQAFTRWDYRANGTQLTTGTYTSADSGTSYFNVAASSIGSIPYSQINSGRLEPVWSGTLATGQSQALYHHQQVASVGSRFSTIGAWITAPSSATNFAFNLAMVDQYPGFNTNTMNVPCHMNYYPTGWDYSVIQPGFVYTTIASGTYSPAVSWDNTTFRQVQVSISGNTATLLLPNGVTTTVTDSRIGSLPGHAAWWEFGRFGNVTAASATMGVRHMYASPAFTSSNPLGKDLAIFSETMLLDTAGGNKLGMDTGTLSETRSVASSHVRSDIAALTEAAAVFASHNRSDTAAGADQQVSSAQPTASDLATLFEQQDMFQGLLKDSTDLASFIEAVSIFATHNRSDTASQTDNRTPYTTQNRTDTSNLTEIEVHGPLASDIASFYEVVQPRFNYIYTSETFNLLEKFEGYFEFSSSDLLSFNDVGVVYEKTRITEDPFVYPASYYGSDRIRVIAQDHFTREFLHWDLPIDNLQLTFTLSGPNLISGKLSTEMESVPELIPDRTWLHVEQGNYIIASFIMTPFVDNPQDQTRQIEGEGFSGYPHWVYYEGEQYVRIQADPADIIRYIWDHVQSFTDGNLRVKVWPTVTSVRIGYPNNSVQFRTREGNEVSIQGEPYNLNFWSATNCGEEINRLCQETPIEFWEYSVWNENKTDVEHYIVLGYPRVGYKRNDLTFREGENLMQLIPSYQESQETYASDVLVIGAGEGPGAVRAKSSNRIGRLRKTNIIQDQNISNKTRAQAIADFELNRISQSRFLIENVIVDTTHTNARWGTFVAGDDIYVECYVPYVGRVKEWHRITTYTYDPYTKIAQLTLEPSDSFSYGGSFYNPYEDLPHEGFAVLSDADFDLSDQSDQDQLRDYNIKLCQQQGVEAFNKNNVKAGFAYAYSQVGNTTSYIMRLITIEEATPPWNIILARTSQGYLITGENVYLVASNGTIGQPPDTTSDTPRVEYSNTGQYSASRSAPFPPGLQLACREYHNAFTGNLYISPELTYLGMSANASSWRQTIGYMFYTILGGQYNYDIKSPGGSFLLMVGNVSRNIGF